MPCSEFSCPDISSTDVPAHRFLKSVHNIVVERGWLRLRLVWGDNVYIEYAKGVDLGIYNENDVVHWCVCLMHFAKRKLTFSTVCWLDGYGLPPSSMRSRISDRN